MSPSPSPFRPSNPLDEALQKIITAAARLHRSGALYRQKSEAFWFFVAGSWPRQKYNSEVQQALKKLPKTVSVEEDLREARKLGREAVMVLKKADFRDARDLEDAIKTLERGRGGDAGR